MKCRYKKPMECFYLTKDNYGKFLKKYNRNIYKNYIILLQDSWEDKEFIKIKDTRKRGKEYMIWINQYYVLINSFFDIESEWFHYTKEEFEEIFEAIE